MGLDKDDDSITAAIRSAVMEKDLADFEHDLETMVGPKGAHLRDGGGNVGGEKSIKASIYPG